MKRLFLFLGVVSAFLLVGVVNTSGSKSSTDQVVESSAGSAAFLVQGDWIEAPSECKTFYTCSFVELKMSKACSNLELKFDILDPNENKVVSAVVMGSGIKQGSTKIYEIGFNNPIAKSVRFSFPTAKCHEAAAKPVLNRGMYNFPADYCSAEMWGSCQSVGLTGQELESASNSSGFIGDEGNSGSGYTVTCNDGWVSQSGGIQGACSHHGGVSD